MSEQSQDTNVAADELLQLRLKELVKRPGYGTVGKPIKLACNYFPLIKLQKDIFGDPFKLAYDGKSTLFTVDELHLKQVSEKADTEKFSFKTVRENKPSELSILIKFTGLVHLDFRNAEAGSLDERKSFKAVRNSFYCIPQGAGADMKYGIELWRGLFISARVIDGFRPAINIDGVMEIVFHFCEKLLIIEMDFSITQLLLQAFHPNQLRLNTRLQPEQLSLLIPELKGVSIHTTHRNQDRIYRIKDILSTAVSMKFKRDGKEVSVAEYFRDVYGPLKYPNFPLVQVGSKKKPIYFPVELCQVAKCQRYNKKLKACQTTSIIRFASTDAPTRILKCIDMVKKSNFNSDPFLKSFGVQIKAEPMIVDGRVLAPPRLEYGKGNGGRQIILTPKDGAWNSNEFKFFESASCESFGFVSFLPPHKASMLQEFCLQIVRTCRSTGIEMPDSPKFYEQAQKNDSVEMVFKRIADKCDRGGVKCDLVFVALFSSEQYAQVKSCGDITFGLVTQCLLPRTIIDVAVKKSYSTMLNIAMKINMKIGGINTKLLEDEVLDNYLYKNNALVIGVDVVHPSAVETHLPSIASVVGNVDANVTKFHASVKIQPAKQELITGFIEQFSDRLLEYVDVNGTTPKNIIVYRDGVSEGQFMQVLEEELPALRRACKSFASNYRPLITFIVVQKRHHARFFCCDEAAARGRGKNIPAGTVIDRVVTSPNEYDFFLCSHHGIQGTSRPTRYHVLFDESNMDANAMQSITYYLCHLYGRCARSVSIPAPVYFADLVCARARYHVLAALNSGLVEKFSDEDSNSSSSSSSSSTQVKSCGDITFGLVTQCLLPRTIIDVAVKKSYSTMLNIAMKINMKIGGINTKLLEDEVLDNYLYKNNALVIGVDVVHPSAVETHLPSIASVVGNVDANVTKFHASVKIQPAKQELITGFIEQFSDRLLEYVDVNGTTPKNIIVYRDGVSEGQFMQVLEEELPALRRACKSFASNYRPLITFIVVQKRHHARFFCCDEAAARGRGKNIPAGTVIDRVVTSPNEYDFFLCSHHGIQGTSRPTRYHVLFDESNMDANAIQSITYYFCHLYGRCARSVSIPAPVYFADLVCARARYHILAALNSGLVEKFSDEDSKGTSSSSITKAESVKTELANIIALHERVKKIMYFA
ncbi:putative protein tag-76 [Trichinella nelsoni]|uniref:Protein argonaute-3 n=2 Tax=Trichinella TaxID=6333 RepID=A0A0V0SFH8_9BILA|nr:putative protein tag-76 [Trichinella nelsoni]